MMVQCGSCGALDEEFNVKVCGGCGEACCTDCRLSHVGCHGPSEAYLEDQEDEESEIVGADVIGED